MISRLEPLPHPSAAQRPIERGLPQPHFPRLRRSTQATSRIDLGSLPGGSIPCSSVPKRFDHLGGSIAQSMPVVQQSPRKLKYTELNS